MQPGVHESRPLIHECIYMARLQLASQALEKRVFLELIKMFNRETGLLI